MRKGKKRVSVKFISWTTLVTGLSFLLIWVCFVAWGQDKGGEYNILDFGAIPDGKTINTRPIQMAIENAIGAGGTVIVPAGKFYTGSLLLGPNMTLRLEKGAELIASKNMGDYNQDEFILAPYADNLVVTGEGTINGNGTSFFDENWEFIERPRPWIAITDSKHVIISGIALVNSPSHCLSLDFCQDVLVKDLHIKNDSRSPNTDGIDIRNSSKVRIMNCDIRTGDDAICLKSSRKPDQLINDHGEQRSRVTKDIRVTDCYLESDDAALKLGTGSGDLITDVTFSNISIRDSRYGIALFMMDGGTYQKIDFSDIHMVTGSRHKQEYAIFMDIHQREAISKVGNIADISFENLDITTNGLLYFSGHPSRDIENISFKNNKIRVPDADDTIANNWIKPKGNKKVKDWPSTASFVQSPATVIIAHATDFKMENISIQHEKGAMDRHALYLNNVTGLDTFQLRGNTLNTKEFVLNVE